LSSAHLTSLGTECVSKHETWSKNELVITLYFSSRHINSVSVSLLLSRRGFQRTPAAVERKIHEIVCDHPSLQAYEGSWDIDAVDHWLDNILGSIEDVNRLIEFAPEDAEIVAQVG
jgi:hypothetical protein